jgi:hypothetical protein
MRALCGGAYLSPQTVFTSGSVAFVAVANAIGFASGADALPTFTALIILGTAFACGVLFAALPLRRAGCTAVWHALTNCFTGRFLVLSRTLSCAMCSKPTGAPQCVLQRCGTCCRGGCLLHPSRASRTVAWASMMAETSGLVRLCITAFAVACGAVGLSGGAGSDAPAVDATVVLAPLTRQPSAARRAATTAALLRSPSLPPRLVLERVNSHV